MFNIIKQVKEEIIDEIPNDLENKITSEIEIENDIPEPVFIDFTGNEVKQEIKNEKPDIIFEIKQESDYVEEYNNFQYKEECEEDHQETYSNIEYDYKTVEEIKISDGTLQLLNTLNKANVEENASLDSNKEEQPINRTCEFCTKTFGTTLSLEDHFLKHHKEEINNNPQDFIKSKIYQCKTCPYATTFQICYHLHMSKNHIETNSELTCQFCTKSYLTKAPLEDHMLKQHENLMENYLNEFITSKIHKCKSCDYKTTFKMCLNQHINTNHSKNDKKSEICCQFCTKTFSTKTPLNDHMLKQHKKLIKNNINEFITCKIYKCKTCCYQTTFKMCLKQHIDTIHNKNDKVKTKSEITCLFCPKTFPKIVASEDHMLKQHENLIKHNINDFIKCKIYKCNACSYQTTFTMCLKQHTNTYHNDKTKSEFNCQFCAKAFATKPAVEDHILKQHKNLIYNDVNNFISCKIYKCEICCYQTTFKMCLNQHIHTNHDKNDKDKPKSEIACKICNNTSFTRKIALDDHMLKKHMEVIKDNVGNYVTCTVHKCQICDYVTVFPNCLKWHENRVHGTTELKIKCQFCEKSFLDQSLLDVHLLQKHDQHTNKEINCHFCEKTFKKKFLLDDHLLKEHKNENVKDLITSKLHECDQCSYSSVYITCLVHHLVKVHDANKSELKCQFCDKNFVSKIALEDHTIKKHHERIIGNLKQFITNTIHKCSLCTFVTTRKITLHNHLASVHDQSKLTCEFCDKTYVKKLSLDDHVLKQHKDLIKDNVNHYVSSKINECSMCDYVTTDKTILSQHLKKVHGGCRSEEQVSPD